MYVLFISGVTSRFIYGCAIDDWAIIIAIVITLALALTILLRKIKHG